MIEGIILEEHLKTKLSKTLFHGTLMDRASNIVYDGIDFDKLNDRADFGRGFYTTDSYALAKDTAILRYHQAIQTEGHALLPVVMRLKFDKRYVDNYNIKEFYGESNDWKRFVCTNRWYECVLNKNPYYDNNYDQKYDIVIGLTADGRMRKINQLIKNDNYNLSDSFLSNITPYRVTYKNINGTINYTKAYQISFHNKEIFKHCMKFPTYDIILLDKEEVAL